MVVLYGCDLSLFFLAEIGPSVDGVDTMTRLSYHQRGGRTAPLPLPFPFPLPQG